MSARCMAHGNARCEECGRISAEYLIEGEGACRGCEHWGETGMHWDTCAGRIRGPVTAGCPVHLGMACPDGCPLTEKPMPNTLQCCGAFEISGHAAGCPGPPDMVAHPPHYTNHPSGIECIQVTEHLNFCIGNAIKYLWRTDDKGDALENLRKARWYVDREIARRKAGAS